MGGGPLTRIAEVLAGRIGVVDARRPLGPDDLFPEEGPTTAPRIARFLGPEGDARWGLVVESSDGLPRTLLDLTARRGLGPGLLDFVDQGGFELAEEELAGCAPTEPRPDLVSLAPEDLPARVLSPVDIELEQIARGERLVVGFGLTYRAHADETVRARPFVFPKPTAPTGAYSGVIAGVDLEAEDAELLDYELELGCVALAEIDLDRLDAVDPARDFAYLVVNDISARGPIVRDRRGGYARAKGRPTYLPAGPWMVHGQHFTRDAPSVRRLVLTVEERDARAATDQSMQHESGARIHTLRQSARLDELALGLVELLETLARRRSVTMSGADGREWPVSVARGGRHVIPRGSLLLTGTPGGTAIRGPTIADLLALLASSLRHRTWPSERYRRHLVEHRTAFGFLSPGDRVSCWISGLGRQLWEVR